MTHSIHVYNHFMNKLPWKQLLQCAMDSEDLFNRQIFGDPNWDTRSLDIFHPEIPKEVQDYGWEYLEKAQSKIEEFAQREVYPDILAFTKWFGRYYQMPHADGEEPDGSPHPFPWRKFGCIYYMNDDYEGGEIYFPNQSIEFKPPANTMVFFPGDLEHLHGVRRVSRGVRYTIASFWTYDKEKRIPIYDSRKHNSSITNS